jgi:hypothetical protein
MWKNLSVLSKTISLKVSLSPPHNYHLPPVLLIYPGGKFADQKDLLCGTPGLIFPHLVNGKFHSNFQSYIAVVADPMHNASGDK